MTSEETFRTLSKSDYKVARSCSAKLFYRELGYPSTKDGDEYQAMLAEGGYMVEELAKLRYPAGIALEHRGDARIAAAETARLLEREEVILFGATLLAGRRLARADILVKRGNSIRLIEVKAKSFNSTENAERVSQERSNNFRNKTAPFHIRSSWRPHLEDITFQVLVLAAMMPEADVTATICLVDKVFKTEIDGFPRLFSIERGLSRSGSSRVYRVTFTGSPSLLAGDQSLVEVDVTAEVADLREEVEQYARLFEQSIEGDMTRLQAPIGAHCRDCEYRVEEGVSPSGFRDCWGPLADATPTILDLYQVSALRGARGQLLVEELLQQGKASLFDVPEEECVNGGGVWNARRLVQLRHTRSGEEWYGENLAHALESVQYPLHFIDFETSRLALPYHRGMRPYGQVAFQWSCHTITERGGDPIHSEWLNTEDYWPNGKFAQSLRERIGLEGTVLAWANHERATIKDIIETLRDFNQSDAELEAWGNSLTKTNRILDMNKLTLDSFFHPRMGGRTSIKVVLDALWRTDERARSRFEQLTSRIADPSTDPYSLLPPVTINGVRQQVVEGTGAMRAYQAMMYGVEREDQEAKEQWRELLLQYCQLDTLAMVLIWEYWVRKTSLSEKTP
ncbi:MAG: DUF2779 domain-containing protein [Acidobacteriota bacterium]